MAEAGIGLTASLIGIATLAYDSCQKLNGITQGLRNAPENVKSISDDLAALTKLLGSLKNAFQPQNQASRGSLERQGVLTELQSAMQGCQELCEEFTQKLSKHTAHSSEDRMSKRDRISLHFNGAEILVLKERLVQYKLTFHIALDVASLIMSGKSKQAIEELDTTIATSVTSLTGQMKGLEIAIQALSTTSQAPSTTSPPDQSSTSETTKVAQLLEQYDRTLKESLRVYTPALQETSRLAGTTVKHSLVLNEAKQHVGNIGIADGGGNLPSTLVELAEARDQARQFVGNMSAEAALALMK